MHVGGPDFEIRQSFLVGLLNNIVRCLIVHERVRIEHGLTSYGITRFYEIENCFLHIFFFSRQLHELLLWFGL